MQTRPALILMKAALMRYNFPEINQNPARWPNTITRTERMSWMRMHQSVSEQWTPCIFTLKKQKFFTKRPQLLHSEEIICIVHFPSASERSKVNSNLLIWGLHADGRVEAASCYSNLSLAYRLAISSEENLW